MKKNGTVTHTKRNRNYKAEIKQKQFNDMKLFKSPKKEVKCEGNREGVKANYKPCKINY